jgi:Family of unknown function (DUF6491)
MIDRLPLIAMAFAAGAVVFAGAAADAANMAGAASPARTCFYRSQVNRFQNVRDNKQGSDSVIVTVGANRKYLFETLGSCPDIDWANGIGFDQTGPGQICEGLDVTLVVPSTIGLRRCPVKMIRQLSEEEAKAY